MKLDAYKRKSRKSRLEDLKGYQDTLSTEHLTNANEVIKSIIAKLTRAIERELIFPFIYSTPLCDGSRARAEFVGDREDSDRPPVDYYKGKKITIVYDRYMCMGAGHCGDLEADFGTHNALT